MVCYLFNPSHALCKTYLPLAEGRWFGPLPELCARLNLHKAICCMGNIMSSVWEHTPHSKTTHQRRPKVRGNQNIMYSFLWANPDLFLSLHRGLKRDPAVYILICPLQIGIPICDFWPYAREMRTPGPKISYATFYRVFLKNICCWCLWNYICPLTYIEVMPATDFCKVPPRSVNYGYFYPSPAASLWVDFTNRIQPLLHHYINIGIPANII